MSLSRRFEEAFLYASVIHAGQTRKGTTIPYISHLMGVASIVLDYGGNETEAIAALLHDAVEDAGGKGRLADIELRFGAEVAHIVAGCTDADVIPKPPWRERKEKYISRIGGESGPVRLVSAADKLHNARSILADYRCIGEAIWDRFNGKKDGTLWYYRSLLTAFRSAGNNALIDELDRVVSELEHLARR
ncbi:MAG: HD domain-containing protein [Planctomycetota bacterium]|nr:HD domain-containing protein [Planctomycetota bacterium]